MRDITYEELEPEIYLISADGDMRGQVGRAERRRFGWRRWSVVRFDIPGQRQHLLPGWYWTRRTAVAALLWRPETGAVRIGLVVLLAVVVSVAVFWVPLIAFIHHHLAR
jgi:hypothetical protein